MKKFYLITAIFILGGCANTTYNAEMCNRIASDPTEVLPKECMQYKLKDAEKAYNNTNKNMQSKEDLEVNKDKE